MASSSSRLTRYHVFLSFRGEDTRLNFTSHLCKALRETGMKVFFDEDTLERGELLSEALSRAIAASDLSIIILSKDNASSKSCLAEVSDIIDRKKSKGHIVLPIFYHVDPSDVRNIGGSFKTSFDGHESKGLQQVQQWRKAFIEVGQLKGWHIEGGKFDIPETEYIMDIVKDVETKLMNKNYGSAFEEWIGIDDQSKNMILSLLNKDNSRVIGLSEKGGIPESPIGKTTFVDAVKRTSKTSDDDSLQPSNKFLRYALKVLGSKLYTKTVTEWEEFESELEELKDELVEFTTEGVSSIDDMLEEMGNSIVRRYGKYKRLCKDFCHT